MILGDNKSLPIGWQWCKAGDVIDVRDGTHDSPKYQESGIPLVTSKNLVHGVIDYSTCSFISEADHIAISKRSLVCDGDILYAMIGTIGNPVVVRKEFEFSIKNVALFKFINDDVFNRYVFHYLKSNLVDRQFRKKARGGTQKFVSLGNIRDLLIPLPPLEEQKRIAAILDKADAVRCKRQQAIDLTDQLLRSVFLDMFGDPVTNPKGWEKAPLVDIAINDKRAIVDGPFGASLKTDEYVENGIPVIRINNIRRAGFYNENFKFITKAKYEELIRSKVIEGDLLIARVGHTIGKSCIFNQAYKALLSTTGVAKVTCDTKIIFPEFLEALWNFKNYQDYIMTNVRGAAQPYLNLTTIKAFEVIKPPLDMQLKYLEVVKQAQKKFDSHGKSSDSLDMLFRALTQQAFKGELIKQSKAA